MKLSFIQGTMRADSATVAAYKKVNKAFKGRLKITSPYGAYRTRAMQQKMYDLFLSGRGATAARPGTSNHEGGKALDIWNWSSFPTLQAVMKANGFVRDAHEQWHYNFVGVPAPKPIARPVVKRGSRNASVGVLQRALKIKADNIFGAQTEAKVKAFQKINGLVPDGIVGNATWGKLASLGKI
tara:strand:+ start:1811 stop:2359 length:549 start_codon:yes stop_codon:yes gene_type:complete